jgi:hypothetical protein
MGESITFIYSVATLRKWRSDQTEQRLSALFSYLETREGPDKEIAYEDFLSQWLHHIGFDRVISAEGVLRLYTTLNEPRAPINAFDSNGADVRSSSRDALSQIHLTTGGWESKGDFKVALPRLPVEIGLADGRCHLLLRYRASFFWIRDERSLQTFTPETAEFLEDARILHHPTGSA